MHALLKILKSITINNRNYFNPATFIEVLVPNEEWVGMYMCASNIDFASFYDFYMDC